MKMQTVRIKIGATEECGMCVYKWRWPDTTGVKCGIWGVQLSERHDPNDSNYHFLRCEPCMNRWPGELGAAEGATDETP